MMGLAAGWLALAAIRLLPWLRVGVGFKDLCPDVGYRIVCPAHRIAVALRSDLPGLGRQQSVWRLRR